MPISQSPNGVQNFLTGPQWDQVTISYAFPQSTGEYQSNVAAYGNNELVSSFDGLGPDAQIYFRYLLDMYASVCGLSFVESSNGDINIGYTGSTSSAHAYLPDQAGNESGDVWFNPQMYFQEFQIGQFSGFVAMHELGHALGLAHPHEILSFNAQFDQMSYTIMSYNSVSLSSGLGYTNQVGHYAQTLMPLDILALQARYGVSYDTQNTDTIYSFNAISGALIINGEEQPDGAGNTIFRSVWDGGGTDILELSNFSDDLSADLRSGGQVNFSQAQLAVLTEDGQTATANLFLSIDPDGSGQSLIENLNSGNGNDQIIGNQFNNIINANAGNDDIQGREGNDILIGGDGDDILRGGHGEDVLSGGNGNNILVGGLGADSFVFESDETTHTVIRDFNPNEDIIIVDDNIALEGANWSFQDGNCVILIGDTDITLLNINEDSFELADIVQMNTNEIDTMFI